MMEIISVGQMIDGNFRKDYEELDLECHIAEAIELPSNHLNVSNGDEARFCDLLLHDDSARNVENIFL